jgi:hypothetical protein
VTSSVSGKIGLVCEVCDSRTESNGEPLTCTNILSGSRGVAGCLNVLAPIFGSPLREGGSLLMPIKINDNFAHGIGGRCVSAPGWSLGSGIVSTSGPT